MYKGVSMGFLRLYDMEEGLRIARLISLLVS